MKISRFFSLAGLSILSLMASITVSGQSLVTWDIAGVTVSNLSSPYSLSGTVVAAEGIATGTLSLGSGVNPTTSADQYGFKISSANSQSTLEGAISNNHYIQITVTAASGYIFNLSSIAFNGQSSATGANNAVVMTSMDGFNYGNQIASVSGIAGITGGLDTDSSGFGSITLSGSQYQNLTSATFRIYGWNTSTSSGSGLTYIRNLTGNDLIISGATALAPVPEPSTYAAILGAVALVGVAVVRHRKRKTIA